MTTFRLDHIGVRLDPATGSFALHALDEAIEEQAEDAA